MNGPAKMRPRFAAPEGSLGTCRIARCRRNGHLRGMTEPFASLAGLTLVFCFAGFVKGVIGMGLPTVAMGFLTLLMPPAEAATILVLPSFVTNVWQLAAGPRLAALARRLWPMLLAATIATVVAARWLGAVSSAGTLAALGAALALYAVTSLAPLRLEVAARTEWWLGPLVGGATGIVTATTGVFVIPAVPYLQALRLAPEDLVQALGLSFTVSTIALAAALADDGQFQWPHAGASVLALAAAIAGMLVGQAVRTRMQPKTFRLWFLVGLLLLGLHLMLRGLI
jgi:uncharacterized membrane protein YfcA